MRRPGARSSSGARWKDLVICALVTCLLLSVVAWYRVRGEREELRSRLSVTLQRTADNAKALESRLKSAMEMLRENEDDDAVSRVPPSVSSSSSSPGTTSLIVFCHNRADYLDRTLASLFARLEGDAVVPLPAMFRDLRVIISQDGHDERVKSVAQKYINNNKNVHVEHIQHARDANIQGAGSQQAYYALAQHYHKGLQHAFTSNVVERVIVLEDDLELAVDFFPYFAAFSPLLDEDESLFCVSAWNDHGQPQFVNADADAGVFYRSDFFPGLGWMLPRRVWVGDWDGKWPRAYWDDWVREPAQRRSRQCIRPALTRTITFGQSGGASQGQFYSAYLLPMQLNTHHVVDYNAEALRPSEFHRSFLSQVAAAHVVKSVADIPVDGKAEAEAYKLTFASLQDYEQRVARQLGIIPDAKAGVPRGAYHGIVPLRFRSHHRLFLVPE